MDGSLIALAVVVLGIIVFDVAALRFGYDSRSGKREMPTAGDIPPKRSHGENHRRRWRRGQGVRPPVVTQLLILSETGAGGAQITRHVVTSGGRNRSTGKPFKLPVSVEAHRYAQFDLAAKGK